jgi:hypothetical protein
MTTTKTFRLNILTEAKTDAVTHKDLAGKMWLVSRMEYAVTKMKKNADEMKED